MTKYSIYALLDQIKEIFGKYADEEIFCINDPCTLTLLKRKDCLIMPIAWYRRTRTKSIPIEGIQPWFDFIIFHTIYVKYLFHPHIHMTLILCIMQNKIISRPRYIRSTESCLIFTIHANTPQWVILFLDDIFISRQERMLIIYPA